MCWNTECAREEGLECVGVCTEVGEVIDYPVTEEMVIDNCHHLGRRKWGPTSRFTCENKAVRYGERGEMAQKLCLCVDKER